MVLRGEKRTKRKVRVGTFEDASEDARSFWATRGKDVRQVCGFGETTPRTSSLTFTSPGPAFVVSRKNSTSSCLPGFEGGKGSD
jgi:hypothetical protein